MEPHSALFAAVGAWIAQDPDANTRSILEGLLARKDAARLSPLFSGRLAFGTAGLRALMGPGPTQMNRLVVRQSALGIAQVLRAELPEACERGVVVAYDGRLLSRQMAEDAAGVLAAQGLAVHWFEGPVPTPLAGFAVKTRHAAGGIVITASHNPKDYNGLKVFWHHAAQIMPPVDAYIARAIDEIAQEPGNRAIPCWSLADIAQHGRLLPLGEELTAAYLRAIDAVSQHAPCPSRGTLGIAYTPLHGVGANVAERALAQAGFEAVTTVQAQREPNGHFPSVPKPNPEEAGSMDQVLALAEATQAALACANDPDADRLAVAARDGAGVMRPLTGDELGLLLADDMLRQRQSEGLVGTTLVSSRLLARLAQAHGAHYFETLTGFKWLAHRARTAASHGQTFVCAYEEALGYALGDVVWDKDGIHALLAIAKLAAALREQGQTLWDRLQQMAMQVGVGVSGQATLALEGNDAAAHMARLRASPLTHLGPWHVVRTDDLLRPADAEERGIPTSDVVVCYLEKESAPHASGLGPRIIVRPSGTEPKMKCYYEVIAQPSPTSPWEAVRAQALSELHTMMALHKTAMQKD